MSDTSDFTPAVPSALAKSKASTGPGPLPVCFVIDRLTRAGTESQLLLQIKALDRRRVRPYLVLLDGQDPLSEELLPSDCPVLILGVRKLLSLSAMQAGRRFLALLRKEQIAAVQTYFPDSTRFAAPLAKWAGVPLILGSRRNIGHWMTRWDGRLGWLYNRWFLDQIVANCGAARDAVFSQEGARPDQVVVIPNGLELDRFEQVPLWTEPLDPSVRRVGSLGNLRHVKGQDLLLQAAQIVLKKHPNACFDIGGGGDPAELTQLAQDLGILDRVRFLGSVKQVPEFLATLDVAVLPSRGEGMSNAVLEYMAAGRPLVVTDVGANRELVLGDPTLVNPPEREAGLVTPVSSQAIAEAIIELLDQPARAARLAAQARQVAAAFDVRHLAEQLAEFLSRGVANKKRGKRSAEPLAFGAAQEVPIGPMRSSGGES